MGLSQLFMQHTITNAIEIANQQSKKNMAYWNDSALDRSIKLVSEGEIESQIPLNINFRVKFNQYVIKNAIVMIWYTSGILKRYQNLRHFPICCSASKLKSFSLSSASENCCSLSFWSIFLSSSVKNLFLNVFTRKGYSHRFVNLLLASFFLANLSLYIYGIGIMPQAQRRE